MAKDKRIQTRNLQEGYQAVQGGYQPSQIHIEQRGYQPQGPAPINLQTLKPPKGDTAIVPPQAPPSAPASK